MTKTTIVMKWLPLLLITITNQTFTHAQSVQITLQPQLSNTFGSKDLWNADLSNPQGSALNLRLRSTLSSSNGQLLLEAVSVPVVISNVYVSLASLQLSAGAVKYYDALVRQSDETTRSLPSGEYVRCIYALNAVTGEVVSQQCAPLSIRALTPPVLIFPADHESVQEKNPLLTWLQPATLSNPSEVRYNLLLVELYRNQAAADGVSRNRPLIYEKGLVQTSLQYPYSAPALEYGKRYAWQVEAVSHAGASYGITEIWEFKLSPDTVKEMEVFPDQSYIDIKNSLSYQVFYAKGKLKIKHAERRHPVTLRYAIYLEDGTPVYTKGSVQALSKDNWFDIDLEKEQRLKHKQKYRFELDNGYDIYKIYFYYIDPSRIK